MVAAATPQDPTSKSTSKTIRAGQAHKRSAILAAARDLFVLDGVERTSMDAVAARASVSKRTVYDYYGDKRGLLLGVVVAAGESLVETLRQAIADHLADDAPIADQAALERALVGFAVQIGETMLGSADYGSTIKLIGDNRAILPELAHHPLNSAPEAALAERIAHFADVGLLDVDDAFLAADHFNALTTLLAMNIRFPDQLSTDATRRTMADGVHAFMRAYGAR